MRIDFVNEVSRLQQIKRTDLIEKDLILHQILLDLSKNKFFYDNFLFKGGTCIIKCYLGYFRFSEDMDFTWKNQKIFEGKSQKEIRSHLSEIIDETGIIFEEIASRRSLDFKCGKSNRNYVELGGSDKTCTFKIWYTSEVLNRKSFVKVQINFVEKLCFTPKKVTLKSILGKEQHELNVLFPEYEEYSEKITLNAYDTKEILCEKVRAILTRRGIKARDFLDVYMICAKFNLELDDLSDCIVEKTQFFLNLYEKYRKNLAEKKDLLISDKAFKWGDEAGLLLQEIEEEDFYMFRARFSMFLKNIIEKLS